MSGVAGNDGEVVNLRDPGDDGVRHSGSVSARCGGSFQPSRNSRRGRVQPENLVVVARNQAGEPGFQSRRLRRRALVVEQGDPLFDFVDGDDRQKNPTFAIRALQSVEGGLRRLRRGRRKHRDDIGVEQEARQSSVSRDEPRLRSNSPPGKVRK